MVQLETSATNNNTCNNDLMLPDTKLHKYLQPILGTACTVAYVQKLEDLNPELKNSDKLKNVFISVIDKIPDEDKNHVVASVLKVSQIKNIIPQDENTTPYSEAYKDFGNMVTRLIPNLYNVAKCADDIVCDKNISPEKILKILESPLASIRTIVLNDAIQQDITSYPEASKEMDLILRAFGDGLEHFPQIVQYIAEKSAQTAEVIFTKKDFRDFPKWQKSQTIQNAQKQVVTGEQRTNVWSTNRIGYQNG